MKTFCIHLLLLFGVIVSYGQDKSVTKVSENEIYGIDSARVVGYAWFFNSQGNVYDFDNNPLPGVVVTYRAKRGIFRDTTDLKGKFYIDSIVGRKGLLRFEKEGYKPLAQYVSSATNIYITLTIDEEGVFAEREIGYGTTNKYKNTAAVTHISGDMARLGTKRDIVECLAGKGGLSYDLKIRGAFGRPLFVVNGIPRISGGSLNAVREALNFINPADIDYVEVLKDAAATAIYGHRGGDGVILIRTKNSRPVKKPKMTSVQNTK